MPQMLFPSRICVSLGHSDPGMLVKLAYLEAERGEMFFEFCLEFLSEPASGPSAIQEFLQRWPLAWIIATCRRLEHSHGPAETQLALLEAAVAAGARAIDLEIETARHTQPWMREMGRRCRRIVSYHNYSGCPDLDPVVRELESIPAEVIKVAVQAEAPDTLQRLVQAASRCAKPNLMLMMGEQGLPLRIMAPILGRSFTYASPSGYAGTASGQIEARILREVWRLDQLEISPLIAEQSSSLVTP
jgi:3-dehydroquinate dehydratase type I